MSWTDDFFCGVNALVCNVQDMLGWSAHSHTRLYTTDAEGILVADDSSMVSLIKLDGTLRLVGDEEFNNIIERLNDILSSTLSRKCHAVQFIAQYDPIASSKTIAGHFAPIRKSAKALQLDMDELLEDWEENLASYCADESVYIAVWTRPTALSKNTLKEERKQLAKMGGNSIPSWNQGRGKVLVRLRDMHLSQVNNLVSFFSGTNFRARFLDSHEALRHIRKMIVPELTADDWQARLVGDPLPFRPAKPGEKKNTNIFPPSLSRQLWPCAAKIISGKYVEIGERIYAPIIMELPPQNLRLFNELFQSLKGEIPWRMSILLTGDGLSTGATKSSIASMIGFANTGNKMFNIAYKQLRELELEGACMVGFQMCFTTWVDKHKKDAIKELSQRSAFLQTSVQSWGSSDTSDLIGDALLGFTATVPCLMPTSPAPSAIAPLSDALQMLPVTRPTSPWRSTDLPLRTPDGRYMPMGLFHSNQASWNEIVFAGMGSGKSFFLNTLNMFYLLRPGQARLPWLTVIDIGLSSSGVMNLIESALPPDKKHLATFVKLRNTASAAINPFDTPLGCDKPLRNHFEFLNNLLSLICTPYEASAPVDGVSSLLREAIMHVYKIFGPTGASPKIFDPNLDQQVTETLKQYQYVWDAHTTWWETVKFLFDLGLYTEAIMAQRFAMPTIADLASAVTNPNVSENFVGIKASEGGETIPEACSRYLVTAITEYPLLANPTKFSLGAAQIVGLDLMEVTPRSGAQAARQSGIMYMMARFVGASHFFNTLDDLEFIPEAYREYHRPRFESLVSDPKRLCYDEFHRASCADMSNPLSRQIISDLTTVSRESRKLNLSIGLYSQQLEDFPKVLVSLATSIYALGAGNAQEAREIASRFDFNDAAYNVLRKINRPTKAGANFVAIYRTSEGESIQYLTNSAGGMARWAFSTTAEDMRLRRKLCDAVGLPKALKALHILYPDGTIKTEIERRKISLEHFEGEEIEDIEKSIYEEILAFVRNGNIKK